MIFGGATQPEEKAMGMSLLRMMGIGREPMSREEIVRMIARKASSNIHEIQGKSTNAKALPIVDVCLAGAAHGPEVLRLRDDIRNGTADDLHEAVSACMFPVTGVYLIAGSSDDSFSVRVRYDLRPRAERCVDRDSSPSP